ncbi:MAG: carboxypeptidase regulatory-like domain-containing protein [Acidobacteria bacterium]|nr:MAG: carboxypeptidase regulatory-like domain-containing protein [Acidobacteriota bacterium]
MRARIAVSVIVVSLIVAFVFAQSPSYEIRGNVVDDSGTALPGVLVTLTGPEQHSTVTGKNGEFAFGSLRSGAYDLRFQLAGFQTFAAQVSLSTRVEHLKITMSIAPLADSRSVQADKLSAAPAVQRQMDSSIGLVWVKAALLAAPDIFPGRCRHPTCPAGTTPTSIPRPTITSTRTRSAGFRQTRSRRFRSTSTRPPTQTSGDS